MREYTKSELLNELSKLYVLQREGKRVKTLTRELEQQLWEKCDEELDAKMDDERIRKNRGKL